MESNPCLKWIPEISMFGSNYETIFKPKFKFSDSENLDVSTSLQLPKLMKLLILKVED
jgi:hypothetical protein